MKMTEKCSHCGLKLIKNKWGDIVCPSCGIVKFHEEESKETPSYVR